MATVAKPRLTAEGNGFKIGLITAVVLILYTASAAILGFLYRIEAGTLDVLILVAGSVFAIKRMKDAWGNELTYFQGFGTGIITALVASVLLGAFFWALGGIFPDAVQRLESRDLFGTDLGILISGLGIILLGTMTGVITSLIAMQYFKSEDQETLTSIE